MRRRELIKAGAALVAAPSVTGAPIRAIGPRRVERLDEGWKFLRDDTPGAEQPGLDDSAWESATLPHTARIEALVAGPAGSPGSQWQGTCWYRRPLTLEPSAAGRKVLLRFEGAMNVADIYLDGERIGGHLGGYLPFSFDISGRVRPGREQLLAVRLDNRDNAITGPKPLAQLDYNICHGLYRPVYLTVADPLHITDPLLADQTAGGGVFVTFPRVSREAATVRVKVHARSDHAAPREFRMAATLRIEGGAAVAHATSAPVSLAPGGDTHVTVELEVTAPRLWSTTAPNLYLLDCELLDGSTVLDAHTERVGIRHFAVARDGVRINGERIFLRGTNRHQEYPYIGYALSDAAQYRDARRIKEAGFDYIRLSHYPHSPAFMDACDELGIVVMDCIPGWQFFNPDGRFVALQYQNCRDMIRRDRNHPCVLFWEVSLNESAMPPEFVARTHAIAHEEYPGDQCFTAGWMRGYDVFVDARQHGGCRATQDRPCLVSEYGDWEYYAMNAGLEQDAWQNLTPAQSNSRQLRWQGEAAQLQQARNFQEAHNDNLATVAVADGLWVMYDYNRGYAPDIEASGCMDLFRLPKYSYHFFRSQRPASERLTFAASGPMVFIASEWTAASAADVRVFSNCEEVALMLNGRLVERRRPDTDRMSTRLAHPPFTFALGRFRAGALEAVGYIGGRRAARHSVRTPGAVARLTLELDRGVRRSERDDIFCYGALRDLRGTIVADAFENVAFGVTGAASLAGANPIATDAGIASILVRTRSGSASAVVHALAILPSGALLGTSVALAGRAPLSRARRTANGAELLVGDRVVASLASDARKVRIGPTIPPDRRNPFRR